MTTCAMNIISSGGRGGERERQGERGGEREEGERESFLL